MRTYSVETSDDGKKHYRFAFAGRDIRLIDHPGTIYSVDSLSTGVYETPLPILTMASVARLNGAFYDVGANIGIYSVLATKTRADLRAYAFEPLPDARKVLSDNLKLNGTNLQTQIFPCALSDYDGMATLYLPDGSHGILETSASLQADFKEVQNTLQVEVKKLDSMEFSEKPSVIKADIEGHEASFINGAVETLKRYRPFLFAEMLSGAADKFFSLSKLMIDLDYVSFRMRPDVVIHTRIIFADKGWNYAFIPSEKMEVFRDCCRTHDIEILKSYHP